jgi:hypothetical protein
MDWIGLAEDRDKWRAVMNVVMNLWVQILKWWLENWWPLVQCSAPYSSIYFRNI